VMKRCSSYSFLFGYKGTIIRWSCPNKIPSFSNYASWLNGHVWPHHMYNLTKGLGLERYGYLLTIQFDYDDWFDHMSNKPSNQLKPKKTPLVKKTIVLINRANNKRAIQIPLVKKTFVVIKKTTYTSI
jgi:hypothetical protein